MREEEREDDEEEVEIGDNTAVGKAEARGTVKNSRAAAIKMEERENCTQWRSDREREKKEGNEYIESKGEEEEYGFCFNFWFCFNGDVEMCWRGKRWVDEAKFALSTIFSVLRKKKVSGMKKCKSWNAENKRTNK